MDNVFERVAYLRGLAEGIELDGETKVGKLLLGVIDAVEELATDVEDLSYDLVELEEYVTLLDDDVTDITEFLDEYDEYDEDEDYDFDFDDLDDYEYEDYDDNYENGCENGCCGGHEEE